MKENEVLAKSERENDTRRPSQFDLKRKSSMFDSVRKAESGTSTCTHHDDPENEDFINKMKVSYENTYKMNPDQTINPGKVQAIAQQVMDDIIGDQKYDATKSKLLIKQVSDKVLHILKKQGFQRYKMVVLVNLGELKGQGVRAASRCLWNDKVDNWTEVSFQNHSMWAMTAVYWFYFE